MKPVITNTPVEGQLWGSTKNAGTCETLAWMKRVCENFKGDGISIEVDRTDEDAPTIRLNDDVMDIINELMKYLDDLINGGLYGTFRWKRDTDSTGKRYGYFTHCHFRVGRTSYTASDNTPKHYLGDGTASDYFLLISHDGGSISGEIVQEWQDNSATSSCIPLIHVNDDGEITADYRAEPTLPLWTSETT